MDVKSDYASPLKAGRFLDREEDVKLEEMKQELEIEAKNSDRLNPEMKKMVSRNILISPKNNTKKEINLVRQNK